MSVSESVERECRCAGGEITLVPLRIIQCEREKAVAQKNILKFASRLDNKLYIRQYLNLSLSLSAYRAFSLLSFFSSPLFSFRAASVKI
jgi:hypothetical protein